MDTEVIQVVQAKPTIPKFDDIISSTITSQVYFNFLINIKEMFKFMELNEDAIVECFDFKRKKNGCINKKTNTGPDNQIFSIRYFLNYKGLDLRKRKKVIDQTGNQIIKLTNFRNQITIDFFHEGSIKNIMLFNSNFKIAGLKRKAQSIPITNFIIKLIHEYRRYVVSSEVIRATITMTMRNIKFSFGFCINKDALINILKKEKQDLFVYEPESTSIKLTFSYTENFDEYDTLEYPDFFEDDLGKEVVTVTTINPKRKKAPNDLKYCTLMIFSSSQSILSGKSTYYNRRSYDFITKLVMDNYEVLKEDEKRIEETKIDFYKEFCMNREVE